MARGRKAGKPKPRSVLKYGMGVSQSTVRRQYARWRAQHDLPDRCDNPKCQFFTGALIWNGQPVPLVLDHMNGVRADNHPTNLRYLCPNCNAQLPTHGGKNRGRVSMSQGGFGVKRADGRWDYTLPAEPAEYRISGHPIGS